MLKKINISFNVFDATFYAQKRLLRMLLLFSKPILNLLRLYFPTHLVFKFNSQVLLYFKIKQILTRAFKRALD